jgi:hypothetical protein
VVLLDQCPKIVFEKISENLREAILKQQDQKLKADLFLIHAPSVFDD